MRYRHDPDGTPAADQARHDDQRRVRADSARAGASPCARKLAHRSGRRPTRSALGSDAPRRSSCRRAAPRRRCSAMNAAYAAGRPPRRLLRDRRRKRRSTTQLARSALDDGRVHLRRPGPLRESDRRVDEGAAAERAAAAASRTDRASCSRVDAPGPRLPALPRLRRVREGRLPRLGHRPHRAVVRAVDAQGRAADDRGGRRDRAHRREAWRARTGCCIHGRVNPNQAGDLEGDGHARRALQDRRVEDVHAVGPGRQGLLPRRRRRASR